MTVILSDLRQKALCSVRSSRFYRMLRSMQIAYEVPVPFCCTEAATPFIQATLFKDASLGWALCNGLYHTRIHYCPFCGIKLPGLRKKETPPAYVSSEHRCAPYYLSGTRTCPDCGPTLCRCSPAVAAWEVEDAPPIHFVAALIPRDADDGEFLSVSRKDNSESKGLPGGKIEKGESLLEAVCREVFEETGLTVVEAAPIFDALDDLGTREVTFLVLANTGKIRTQEKGLVEWLPARDLKLKSSFGRYNTVLFERLDYFLMSHVD